MNLSFSSKKTNLFGAWPHSTFINYTDYIQSLLVYKTFSSFFLSGSLAHPSFSSLVTFQLIEFSFNGIVIDCSWQGLRLLLGSWQGSSFQCL